MQMQFNIGNRSATLGIWISCGVGFIAHCSMAFLAKHCPAHSEALAYAAVICDRMRRFTKRHATISAILGIALYLSLVVLIVRRYVHQFEARVLTVNGLCIGLQKVGIAAAIVCLIVHRIMKRQVFFTDFSPKRYPLVFMAFWVNRLGSLIPPVYLLLIGWNALPWFVKLVLYLDVLVALWAAKSAEAFVRSASTTAEQWYQRFTQSQTQVISQGG